MSRRRLPDIRLRAQIATRKHNPESKDQRLHDQILIVIIACPQSSRSFVSTPHPGPLLVWRGEGELFCGTFSRGSPECFRGNHRANIFCPMGQASLASREFCSFCLYSASPRLRGSPHPVRVFEQSPIRLVCRLTARVPPAISERRFRRVVVASRSRGQCLCGQ